MNLKKQLLLKRGAEGSDLSSAQLTQVQADAELTALMEENAALAGITAGAPPAPPWENLRAGVIARAMQPKENLMKRIDNLLFGKRWYARLGLAMLALLIIGATLMIFKPTAPQAWATSNGQVLKYVLPAEDHVDGEDCQCSNWDECNHEYFSDFGSVITAWAEEQGEALAILPHDDDPDARLKAYMKTIYAEFGDCGPGEALFRFDVTLAGFTADELASLNAAVAANTSLPEPCITDATFYHVGEMNGEFAYSIMLGGEQFCFPDYATEEYVEDALNAWVEANYDTEGLIEVTIENDLFGRKSITIDTHDCVPDEAMTCMQ